MTNYASAARATRMFPFNPTAVHDSVFVRNLTPEEQERLNARIVRNANRLDIRMKNITSPEMIIEISNSLRTNPKFSYLSDLQGFMTMSCSEIIHQLKTRKCHGSTILSPITNFYKKDGAPVMFG